MGGLSRAGHAVILYNGSKKQDDAMDERREARLQWEGRLSDRQEMLRRMSVEKTGLRKEGDHQREATS